MTSDKNIFTISTLNNYIKTMFDSNFVLRNISVRGEISNYKQYPNGHIYFSLKDDSSSLKAVMFYDYARKLKGEFKVGDEVIIVGRISVYPARGEYQLYAETMELYGKGAQLIELELLKKKLAAEGLFDESRKKKVNIFAKRIGVISAPHSAAISDIYTNLLRRNPLLDIVLIESMVQGEGAPKELIKAVQIAKNNNLDTLIIGRGGGASEDLNAFNDEALIREVATLTIPVISAVGHEIDYTLLDYVADLRASTPTGAAELATFDKREIYQKLVDSSDRLDNLLNNKISSYKSYLDSIKRFKYFVEPKLIYKDKLERINVLNDKLDLLIKHRYDQSLSQIKSLKTRLETLSVNNTLNRGYSILEDENGIILKSVKQIKINDTLSIKLSDGTIKSKVLSKEE